MRKIIYVLALAGGFVTREVFQARKAWDDYKDYTARRG